MACPESRLKCNSRGLNGCVAEVMNVGEEEERGAGLDSIFGTSMLREPYTSLIGVLHKKISYIWWMNGSQRKNVRLKSKSLQNSKF